MESPATLIGLAKLIVDNATVLDQHFLENGLPQPGFHEDAPPVLPPFADPSVSEAHKQLLDATRQLHLLALGPLGSIRSLTDNTDLYTLTTINHFRVAKNIPLHGNATFKDLAKASRIPEVELTQILRYAMTNRIFCEPQPGVVAHTAASRLLVESQLAQNFMDLVESDTAVPPSNVIESLEKHPDSGEPSLSPWGLANDASSPLFEELGRKDPERANRFAKVIDAFASFFQVDPTKGFDWQSLGEALVVDVGGGHGRVAIQLAKTFPKLKFILQDLSETVEAGAKALPVELKDRIQFQEHNFFSPQPCHNADVFYFRATFHNWPDKYAIRILKALIPGLKKGAKVFIEDPMTYEPGTAHAWDERSALTMSLAMFKFFNSRDRLPTEWPDLVARADSRFTVKNVGFLAGRRPLSLVELEWEG